MNELQAAPRRPSTGGLRGLLPVLCLVLGTGPVIAEEGMWPPGQVPEIADTLREAGLKIEPGDLADFGAAPLGAVVRFGSCSGAFVSPRGLVLTNHHCALRTLHHNSTDEEDLLERGFLARNPSEELPAAPGVEVAKPLSHEDVTDRIAGGLKDLGPREREAAIERRRGSLESECEARSDARCRVVPVQRGVRYTLVRELVLSDLRLVYAPPAGIGHFGGEVDNFRWPRHAGDFALFRAYVRPAGNGAATPGAARPFRPDVHLSIAQEPLVPGDPVLVLGFPDTTKRHTLPAEVEYMFRTEYPVREAVYETWLGVLKRETEDRPEAARRYARDVAGLDNALTFVRGMRSGFEEADFLERRRRRHEDLMAWIRADPKRQQDYQNVVDRFESALEARDRTRELELRYRRVAESSDVLRAARQIVRLARQRREGGVDERAAQTLRHRMERWGDGFDPRVDWAVWKAFILAYHRLPENRRRADLDRLLGLEPGREARTSLDRVLDRMYAETRLPDRAYRLGLLDAELEKIEASEDPFLRLALDLLEGDLRAERRKEERRATIEAARRDYAAVLFEYHRARKLPLYPDADGTLRIAWGRIPDGTESASAFTTGEGVVAKTTGEEPFDTPKDALRALREERWGQYEDARSNSLPVNFRSTADVTEGNSGSPTLNRHGKLVGILFDTTFENVVSAWGYLPSTGSAIHADARYLLWHLDEVLGAEALIEELEVDDSEDR